MLYVYFKKSLILTLCIALFSASTAWADIPAEFSPEEFRQRAKARIAQSYVYRNFGSKVFEAHEKYKEHPVTGGVKDLASNVAIAAVITFLVVAIKEFKEKMDDRKFGISRKEEATKYLELDTSWPATEKSLYAASDSALAFGPTKALEFLTAKYFPKFAEKELGGKMMNSFVVGLLFSVGINFINEVILMSCRYLVEHDKDEELSKYLPGGPLTNDELKAVTLLEGRTGLTLFGTGIIGGGPVTRSAYRKVFATLNFILRSDDDLRNLLWSHVVREAVTDGRVITTFSIVTAGSAMRPKFISEAKKFKLFKKTGYTIALYALPMFIPDDVMDKLSFSAHRAFSFKISNPLSGAKTLSSSYVDSAANLKFIFEQSRLSREEVVNDNLTVTKLAVEKIETLVERQKKMITKLEATSDEAGKKTQNTELAAGSSKISVYQNLVTQSMNFILNRYQEDLERLTDLHFADSARSTLLQEQISTVKQVMTTLQYRRNLLAAEYSIRDFNYELDPDTYSSVRRTLTQDSYWGFFESGT